MASTKVTSLKSVYINFKDDLGELLEVTDFSVISWLALGMSLQLLSQAWLPPNLSYWLPLSCLIYKLTRSTLDCTGMFRRPFAAVNRGTWTTTLPDVNESSLTATNDGIVMFVLGARFNHAFGKLSPGTPDIDSVFKDMWKEAEANRDKWSYLGKTRALLDIADDKGHTIFWLTYWKDLKGLQDFATSAAHRLGRNAYADQKYPHVGIMHETYHAPRGHWETVYVNTPPMGMGTVKPVLSKGPDGFVFADALKPSVKGSTMYSRMGRK